MNESILYLDKNDIFICDIPKFMNTCFCHNISMEESSKYIRYRAIYENKVKGYKLKWKSKNDNLILWMRKVEDLFEKFYGVSIEFVEDDDGVGYEASLDYYIKTVISVKNKDYFYYNELYQRGFGSFFGYLFEKGMISLGFCFETNDEEKLRGDKFTMGIKPIIELDATNSSIKDLIDGLSNYISISDKKDFENYIKYRSLYELKNIEHREAICNLDEKGNIDNWIKETEKLFEEFYHSSVQFAHCKTRIETIDYLVYSLDLVSDGVDLYIKVLYDPISDNSSIIHKGFGSFFGYLYEKGMIGLKREINRKS